MKNKTTLFDLLVAMYENKILSEYDGYNKKVNLNFLIMQYHFIIYYYKTFNIGNIKNDEKIILYMHSDSNIMQVFREVFDSPEYSDADIASWTEKDFPKMADAIKDKVKIK